MRSSLNSMEEQHQQQQQQQQQHEQDFFLARARNRSREAVQGAAAKETERQWQLLEGSAFGKERSARGSWKSLQSRSPLRPVVCGNVALGVPERFLLSLPLLTR